MSSKRGIGLPGSPQSSSSRSHWSKSNVMACFAEETLLQDSRVNYPLKWHCYKHGIVIQSSASEPLYVTKTTVGGLHAITLLGWVFYLLSHCLCVNDCWSKFGASTLVRTCERAAFTRYCNPFGRGLGAFQTVKNRYTHLIVKLVQVMLITAAAVLVGLGRITQSGAIHG